MRGSWWRWLSAVLATIFGLAFGWVVGTGLVQAAEDANGPAPSALPLTEEGLSGRFYEDASGRRDEASFHRSAK